MQSKNLAKKTAEYFFELAILILLFGCQSPNKVGLSPVRPVGDFPPLQNSNQHYHHPATQHYYQPQPYYQNYPASRYYSNPYSIPATTQANPYYDTDQYYIPPTYYRNVEPYNNQSPRSNVPDAFSGSANKI